jgi:L-amino acid N-acyltransferase YncA
MTLKIRLAEADNAPAMTDLLNGIISAGGTTAHQRPFDPERMRRHYIAPDRHIATHVATSGDAVVGFQMLVWPDPKFEPMPDGWGFIATFVRIGMTGQGIGTSLFAATCTSARAAGCRHIDATIRADNAGGLRYYAAMGFADYGIYAAVPLRDGTPVDRIRKRFDLV